MGFVLNVGSGLLVTAAHETPSVSHPVNFRPFGHLFPGQNVAGLRKPCDPYVLRSTEPPDGQGGSGGPATGSGRSTRQPVPWADVGLGKYARLGIGTAGDKGLSHVERGSFEYEDQTGN